MNSRFHSTGPGRRAYAALALATALIACASPLRAAADVSLHGRDVTRLLNVAVAHHYHSSIRGKRTEAACYFDPQIEKSTVCRWSSGFSPTEAVSARRWVKRELRRECRSAGGKDCVVFFRNGELEFDGLSAKDTERLEAILQKLSSDDVEATPPPDGFSAFSRFRNRFEKVRDYWKDYRKKNSLKNVHYVLCSNDRSAWASFVSQGHGTRLPNVRKMCVLKCNAIAQWYESDRACYVVYEDGQFANATAEQAVMGEN